eukprot:1674873-Rhodomonas_salina.1
MPSVQHTLAQYYRTCTRHASPLPQRARKEIGGPPGEVSLSARGPSVQNRSKPSESASNRPTGNRHAPSLSSSASCAVFPVSVVRSCPERATFVGKSEKTVLRPLSSCRA